MTITIRNADLLRTVTLEDVADVAKSHNYDVRATAEGVNYTNRDVIERLRADLEDLQTWRNMLDEAGLDGVQFAGEVDDILTMLDEFEMHDDIPTFDLEDLID